MADKIIIENPVQSEFGMVPARLWLMDMSYKAKAVAAYLLCQHGAVPRVGQIESDLGIGRQLRQAAMRELTEAGIIRYKLQKKNGVIVARNMVVSTVPILAEIVAQASEESHLAPENPSVGKSTSVRSKNNLTEVEKHGSSKERNINKKRDAKSGKFLKDPFRSDDTEVKRAVDCYFLEGTPQSEKEQIDSWLQKNGYRTLKGGRFREKARQHYAKHDANSENDWFKKVGKVGPELK